MNCPLCYTLGLLLYLQERNYHETQRMATTDYTINFVGRLVLLQRDSAGRIANLYGGARSGWAGGDRPECDCNYNRASDAHLTEKWVKVHDLLAAGEMPPPKKRRRASTS